MIELEEHLFRWDRVKWKEFTVYPTSSAQGQGSRFAGPAGIVLNLASLILFSTIIIHNFMLFWSPQTSAYSSVNSLYSPAIFFRWIFPISNEEQLFLIIALGSAIGSLVHVLRSFFWYAGNHKLSLSWLAMYIPLQIIRALLGLIFYITIHGGLFPHAETSPIKSTFGFVAISALGGLFSVQAALKLREILNTIFEKGGEVRIQDSRLVGE